MPLPGLRIVLALLLMAGVAAFSPAHAAAPPETVEGWLGAVWADARQDLPQQDRVAFWLTTRDGTHLRLEATPAVQAALLKLDRRHVRVGGQRVPAQAQRPGGPPPAPVFQASEVQVAAAGDASAGAGAAEPIEPYAPSLGKRPWINLMCKFQDLAGSEPADHAYFSSMFSSTRPGLDYYWKELSNGQLSVSGSRSAGWYILPQPKAYYFDTFSDGQQYLNTGRLLDDCTAVADADVNFAEFAGINLNLNDGLGCCSYGGAGTVMHDGGPRVYGVTWMADWGWRNHTVFGHEMGHGMGLHHSRGNNQTYRNLWDVMSDIWHNCHLNTDAAIGCLGQHMIAWQKDRAGWIPAAARYEAAPGTRQTIRIDKLERPAPGLYQMARIPISGNPEHFYTVEVRRKYSYDVRVPGASVVIHEVIPDFAEAANVVDGDGNGDPYDAGTRWLPGETFVDERRGISVAVDAADGATGFMVTIESRDGHLFSDGFETGDFSRWGGGKFDNGDLAVSAAAAMVGSLGMRALIDDNNQVHVTDHTPVDERSYRARFRFNPNSLAMAAGNVFTLFGAYGTTLPAAIIELRKSGGWFELRAAARLNNGAMRLTPWVFIADGHHHDVELEWGAATAPGMVDGRLRFVIDESVYADYVDVDNDTLRVERGLLGGVTGIDSGTRGTIYFDDFVSRRW